ncbi:MAG: hypothetical protein WD077_03975 [Bacteroidia bacterium]
MLKKLGPLAGLLSGPFLFLLVWTGVDEGAMGLAAKAVMAVTCWVAAWWITGAVPLPVT